MKGALLDNACVSAFLQLLLKLYNLFTHQHNHIVIEMNCLS